MQRAKYVPPHKRGGGGAAPVAAAVPLNHEEGRPLYNWLNSGVNLTFSRIVGRHGNYVTLELVERPHISGAARTIRFKVHNYFSANPILGGIWASGVHNCEVGAAENPRTNTLLQLWANRVGPDPNPRLEYDNVWNEWDIVRMDH